MIRRFVVTWLVVSSMAAIAPVRADVDSANDALRRKDYDLGLRLMVEAADRGDARAAARLGEIFELGIGTRRDAEQAVRWRQLAAERGDPESALRIGRRFAAGDGVARSDEAARSWYRIAAEQGHPVAQLELSKLLGSAGATDSDVRESATWYERAMSAGAVTAPAVESRPVAPTAPPGPTLTDLRNEREHKRLHGRAALRTWSPAAAFALHDPLWASRASGVWMPPSLVMWPSPGGGAVLMWPPSGAGLRVWHGGWW